MTTDGARTQPLPTMRADDSEASATAATPLISVKRVRKSASGPITTELMDGGRAGGPMSQTFNGRRSKGSSNSAAAMHAQVSQAGAGARAAASPRRDVAPRRRASATTPRHSTTTPLHEHKPTAPYPHPNPNHHQAKRQTDSHALKLVKQLDDNQRIIEMQKMEISQLRTKVSGWVLFYARYSDS